MSFGKLFLLPRYHVSCTSPILVARLQVGVSRAFAIVCSIVAHVIWIVRSIGRRSAAPGCRECVVTPLALVIAHACAAFTLVSQHFNSRDAMTCVRCCCLCVATSVSSFASMLCTSVHACHVFAPDGLCVRASHTHDRCCWLLGKRNKAQQQQQQQPLLHL